MTLSTRPRGRLRGPFFDPAQAGDVSRPGQPAGDAAVAASGSSSGRRADLDWIRVAAFGLLILYHVSLVYAPFDWHIRSRHTFTWMREALLVSSPWRLTLLFLVSGAALRLMSARKSAAQMLSARFWRLGPPLVFGVVALVPIQSWVEAMDKGSWSGSLPAWLAREFSPAGLANGVPVNHLWFLLYIGVYTFVAIALFGAPQRRAALEARLARALEGWGVLLVPAAYLIAVRVLLFPWFGLTNQLNADWYNHALSFGAFAFGFLTVGRDSLWRDLERFRWIAAAIAAVALPLVMIQDIHPGGGAFHGVPRNTVFAIDQWAVIAAVLGFGSRHLRNASGPVLSYLNQAVFPCYLAHQTVLVLTVWLIKPANLPAVAEVAALVVATFVGSLLAYEAVRRAPLIRPLWGLKPEPHPPFQAGTRRYVRRRQLLALGIAAPVLALASVSLAIAAYPGFNHARQYLSELGGAAAATPIIFNGGVMAAGVMAGLAGAGFGLAIVALTNARIIGVLTAAAFIVAACGLATASIYPWPDPRHMAINLGLGIQIAPLLMLWGLWSRRDLPGLKLFLAVIFVAMAVLTVVTKHLVFPGVVNDGNVGWWETAYAVVLVGWVGVAAFVLDRRLHMERPAAETA